VGSFETTDSKSVLADGLRRLAEVHEFHQPLFRVTRSGLRIAGGVVFESESDLIALN
jgi:hypothetical protein